MQKSKGASNRNESALLFVIEHYLIHLMIIVLLL